MPPQSASSSKEQKLPTFESFPPTVTIPGGWDVSAFADFESPPEIVEQTPASFEPSPTIPIH